MITTRGGHLGLRRRFVEKESEAPSVVVFVLHCSCCIKGKGVDMETQSEIDVAAVTMDC